MTTKYFIRLLPLALLLLGAGCVPYSAPRYAQPAPAAVAPAPQPQPVAIDPYAGWGELQPGGVVSLRIPPGCYGDPGAGNIYVTCGTDRGDETKTVLHTSSDGMQVNIRHGAVAWDQWDKVIASLRMMPHLDRDVQINIQK